MQSMVEERNEKDVFKNSFDMYMYMYLHSYDYEYIYHTCTVSTTCYQK